MEMVTTNNELYPVARSWSVNADRGSLLLDQEVNVFGSGGEGCQRSAEMPVSFTRFESTTSWLSKKFDIGINGEIVKTPAAQMSRGIAQRMDIDFFQLPEVMRQADHRVALGYGTYDKTYGNTVAITLSGQERPEAGVISRSKSYFRYGTEPGILMLDHDPGKRGWHLGSATEFLDMLEDMFPRFGACATYWRGSLSAGVHCVGELPVPGKGFHLYIPVWDASDIPRAGNALFKHLWLRGEGSIELSACGAFLVRTLVDRAVFSPERLDFVGSPVLGPGLAFVPPPSAYRPGGYFDTRMIRDLTEKEERRFEELVLQAKNRAKPEAEIIRRAWCDQQVERMAARGTRIDLARAQVNRIAKGGERVDLCADYLLVFEKQGCATVAEVLAKPEQFDSQALADPIEGVAYGRTTAKYWANADGGRPCINSMAHGGMQYFLHSAEGDWSDAYTHMVHEAAAAPVSAGAVQPPVIRLTNGNLPLVVDACEAALLSAGELLFQRSGEVVRFVRQKAVASLAIKRAQDPLLIALADSVYLTERVMRSAFIEKMDARKKQWVRVDLPRTYMDCYLARRCWNLPALTGVIEAPTLRDDGSILEIPGYDSESGLFFEPGSFSYPALSQKPTRQDAEDALQTILRVLAGFPFQEESDRATAVAAILTALIRRSMDYAPLFALDGTTMGSGKTLLANVIALVATGREAAVMMHTDDEAEVRKRLVAALLEGDAVLCIDNIEGCLQSEALCSVLTTTSIRDRLLGKTQMIRAPTHATFIATGNNLQVMGDLTRRVLPCRLDAQVERPYERRFDVHLPTEVARQRVELVTAALTILRAYHVAGRPDMGLKPFGGFEQWGAWVRAAVVWLGMTDPCQGLERWEMTDAAQTSLLTLLVEWYEHFGSEPLTVKSLIETANGFQGCASHSLLWDALEDVAGDRRSINRHALGVYLRKNIGRIESGYRLESAGKSGCRQRYRVKKLGSERRNVADPAVSAVCQGHEKKVA